MQTVEFYETAPGNKPRGLLRILIRLVTAVGSPDIPGRVSGSSRSLTDVRTLVLDEFGKGSIALETNVAGTSGAAEITEPVGSYWEAVLDDGLRPKVVWTFQVPNTPGPIWVGSCPQIVAPGALPSASALAAHEANAADPHAAAGYARLASAQSFTAAQTFTNTIYGIQAASTNTALATKVTAEAFERFHIDVDGTHRWGPGTATRDTNLYRSAADILKTDDAFHSGDEIKATANVTARNGAASEVALGLFSGEAAIRFGGSLGQLLYAAAGDGYLATTMHLRSSGDETTDLGKPGSSWRRLFARSIYFPGATGTVGFGLDAVTDVLTTNHGFAYPSAVHLKVGVSNTLAGGWQVAAGAHLLPLDSSQRDLGSPTAKVRDGWFGGVVVTSAVDTQAASSLYFKINGATALELDAAGHALLTADFNPTATNAYNLGSVSAQWKRAFLFADINLGAAPAAQGTVRLSNGATIYGRNNANTLDKQLFFWDAVDDLTIGAGATRTRLQGQPHITLPQVDPGSSFMEASTSVWYLDEPANKIKVRVNYANGTTTKVGELALI